MFYLKLANLNIRNQFIDFLKSRNISSVFHYVPLHSSPAGNQASVFSGSDVFTTKESERLVRLPIFYGISPSEQAKVISAVSEFFA